MFSNVAILLVVIFMGFIVLLTGVCIFVELSFGFVSCWILMLMSSGSVMLGGMSLHSFLSVACLNPFLKLVSVCSLFYVGNVYKLCQDVYNVQIGVFTRDT